MSGRLVEATSTFLLATARIEASCEPENMTFAKCFFTSTPSSFRKNVMGTRYPEVEFGSLKAKVFPARSSGLKMSESGWAIRHERYPREPFWFRIWATGSTFA